MSSPILLIRADATTSIGTGHVMRCLALAQAWRREGGMVYHLGEVTANLEERLKREGIATLPLDRAPGSDADAMQTLAQAESLGADWIVVDGYHFTASYLERVKSDGQRVLFVDDFGQLPRYPVDFILNQNSYADVASYAGRDPDTQLLLGCRYALLREEFLQRPPPVRSYLEPARRVLITLGGSDPDNITLRIVRSLVATGAGFEIKVILGGSNLHRDTVAEAMTGTGMELIVNSNDMPGLMEWAEVAIAAGGSTSWELMYMGLPPVLVTLADNQCQVVDDLDQREVAIALGWPFQWQNNLMARTLTELAADPTRLQAMSERGRRLVDGRGAERTARLMLGQLVTVRPAGTDDARLLFDWANETGVRTASFQSKPIIWEDHEKWFARKLAGPDCELLIGLSHEGDPIGMVRFDLNAENVAVVSISVDSQFRGYGFGSIMLCRAMAWLEESRSVTRYIAMVKVDNGASTRLFEKCGFDLARRLDYEGVPALEYHRQPGSLTKQP